MSEPTNFRWGIIATGMISKSFVGDLLIDPATRDVHRFKHVVQAVASRSKDSAQEFIAQHVTPKQASPPTAYGSYQELFDDKQIDAVYIGTPHNLHYGNVNAALSSGKHVLVEKPFTVTAQQAQALVDLARSKKLFLMEAVWTRFQPFSYKLQQLIADGEIGKVKSAHAELASNFETTARKNPEHRLVNPDLAGGALLDLGPYPWTQLMLSLFPASEASPEPLALPKITSSMTKTSSGVDATTTAVLEFTNQTDGTALTGTMTASQTYQSAPARVLVVNGTKGYIEVNWPTFRPSSLKVVAWKSQQDYDSFFKPEPVKTETFDYTKRPGGIFGMAWEADEVAQCVLDGKTESDRMPLRETILMAQVFDEIRRQSQLRYPEHVESLDL
ncbi:hypothetical protein OIV83_002086 [Microbotryomycetes sp. JL201]|nr:hypothetical protein OIV83_002086 [Microbotryomycetes sp. JL201]